MTDLVNDVLEWIDRVPTNVALQCGATALTYRELDERSRQIANSLLSNGVQCDDVVGVIMGRSVWLPVVLLGILRAGAAYLPVDPEEPPDRVKASFLNASVITAVTDGPGAEAELEGVALCHVDSLLNSRPSFANSQLPTVDGDGLQYVIRTSGSTGRPKAIAMQRGPQDRLVAWTRERYKSEATCLQYFPSTSDVASLEVFGTWATGGRLVIANDEQRHDVEALARLIDEAEITRVLIPVPVLHRLAELHATKRFTATSLNEIVTTGERLVISGALRAMIDRLGDDIFVDDHYGSSEVNVVIAPRLRPPAHEWPDLPQLTNPIVDAQVLVLDGDLNPVPPNVTGEIFIGGQVQARGYLGQAATTAAAFLPNPFASEPGSRMYRTGDLGRWRPGGRLELMGRADFQIKHHGYRIEPAEIELALEALGSVDRAVVRLVQVQEPQRHALVAYVQPSRSDRFRFREEVARRAIATTLPVMMIPEAIIAIDEMPVLSTGKVDRSRLPQYEGPASDSREASDDIERAILRLWSEILGTDLITPGDNFFALGGHSLLVTRVIYEIRDEFGIDLPILTMFQEPTVEGLAREVRERLKES